MIRASKSLLIGLIIYANCMFFMANSFAAGFQLSEGNAANVGDFWAGGAANLSDASAAFFNPAALSKLPKQQILLAGTGIFKTMHFKGKTVIKQKYTDVNGKAQIVEVPDKGDSNASKKVSDTGEIPALFYGVPVNDKIVFGAGISVPFGLATEWPNDSAVRYEATKSKIVSINFGPSMSYKINNNFAIGAGVDIQFLKVTINSAAVQLHSNSSTIKGDSFSKNSANGIGYGFNVGALVKLYDPLTLSVHYRSRVKHSLTGDSEFDGPLDPNGLAKSTAKGNLTLPDSVSISSALEASDRLMLMASAYYTNWSTIQTITLNSLASPAGPFSQALHFNFKNTWKFVGGMQFKYNSKLLLRTGAGFESTPTKDADRNIRMPDNDRVAIAIGCSYKFNKTFTFDFGYTHVFMKDAPIDHSVETATQISVITGKVHNHADLISLQVIANLG